MDTQTTVNATDKTATLRLHGPCATEHAAGLAAAWGDLLAKVDAAQGRTEHASPPTGEGWAAFLDISEATAVGLAFFEVTTAAAAALARRGLALSRQGTLPETIRQAARISGFSRTPGLAGIFSLPEDQRSAERR